MLSIWTLMRLFQSPATSDLAKHAVDVALSVLDYAVKAAVSLGALWLAVAKIAKPFSEWRRNSHRQLTVEVLSPELTRLQELAGLRGLCEEILDGQKRILARQEQTFEELNIVHSVAHENSERHDEINELLDALGFSSERRREANDERRKVVDKMLADLRARKLARDRVQDDDVDLSIPQKDWPD